VSGNSFTCYSPTSKSSEGLPMLRTVTPLKPKLGLTYISLTWNGQQYGSFDETKFTQKLWYHNMVETVAAVPSGGKTTDAQMITIFGNNFVNTRFLMVRFGENLAMCAFGAPLVGCPVDTRYICDAITFISAQEIHFRMPTNGLQHWPHGAPPATKYRTCHRWLSCHSDWSQHVDQCRTYYWQHF